MQPDVPTLITQSHDDACRWPIFDEEAEQAVLRILRDGNVSTHSVNREFEDLCRETFQRTYAVGHNNGTAGLLAAFHALDLEPGDEVLVPSATFWASVLPMVWCGLVPVFCESEPRTLGIDPADAATRITPRTRAIVVIHLWGLPSDMAGIKALADTHHLRIVEDASHAHGASWQGIPCGALGDLSVFSFQGDKLAPAGEGGVLLTDDYDAYERAVCLGDITKIIELETAQQRFAATSMGIKTRLAPLSAALGCHMLRKLPENNGVRNRNHEALSVQLEELGFECFRPDPGVERVYFEFMVRHPLPSFDTVKLINLLQQMGCRVDTPRYPLLHQQPFFTEGWVKKVGRYPAGTVLPDYAGLELPLTERENQRLIRLPNFPHPDNGIIDEYALAFAAAMEMLL